MPDLIEMKLDSFEQSDQPQQAQSLPQLSILKLEKLRGSKAWLILCVCNCHLISCFHICSIGMEIIVGASRSCFEGKLIQGLQALLGFMKLHKYKPLWFWHVHTAFPTEMNVNISGDFCVALQTNSDSYIWSLPSTLTVTCSLVQSSLASSLWTKPAEKPESSGTYIQMFSSHFAIYTQLQWYFSISPKNQEIEAFPHVTLFALSCSKRVSWCEEISGCLEHSFLDRRGLLASEHFFLLLFFCFFILSKDLPPCTTRSTYNWHEGTVQCL